MMMTIKAGLAMCNLHGKGLKGEAFNSKHLDFLGENVNSSLFLTTHLIGHGFQSW